MPIVFIVCGIALVVILLICLFATSYIKARPDEAVRVSGLGKPKYLVGRAGFKLPFFQRKDRISLKAFQVDIKTKEAIPTNEFININVDAVANLKISSNPELLPVAFETVLSMSDEELISQTQEVLQGNMREIIGTVNLKQLVQDRQGVSKQVQENVIPDMKKLGIDLLNFNIQNFSDNNNVIENLGIDNVARISKDAAIAKANANKEIAVAQAEAEKISNDARVDSQTKITEKNTELSLKQSELKQKTETAKATADASYAIEQQKRQQEINIATVNATIAQREREVELGNKQVELAEKKLAAEVNKKADAEKYATEQKAQAELFKRQKEAEAEKFELERQSEMKKIAAEAEKEAQTHSAEADRITAEKKAEALKLQAEAEARATIARANANREAALAEAEGIKAKGEAEAEALLKKADAMKQYGDAATLQMILDSGLIPEVVKAYSAPMAEAYSHIGNITMYGEGNNAKLAQEIGTNGTQIFDSLNKTLGLDLKSVLAGLVGGKLISNVTNEDSNN